MVVGRGGGCGGQGRDTFHVSFPTTPVVFDLEVTEVSEDVVEWNVPSSPPWWAGTTIRFELEETENAKTGLLFTHSGFDAVDPIIAIIAPAWVRFLDNLMGVAASGRAAPAVVN